MNFFIKTIKNHLQEWTNSLRKLLNEHRPPDKQLTTSAKSLITFEGCIAEILHLVWKFNIALTQNYYSMFT